MLYEVFILYTCNCSRYILSKIPYYLIRTAKDEFGNNLVLKISNKELVTKKIGLINEIKFKVLNNINNEGKTLKYIKSLNPPNSILNFIDFGFDDNNYYLITKYVGESLYKHVMNLHALIDHGILSIKKYRKHVQILFKQIVLAVNWLHNTAGIAHMNISLENSMKYT